MDIRLSQLRPTQISSVSDRRQMNSKGGKFLIIHVLMQVRTYRCLYSDIVPSNFKSVSSDLRSL